MRQIIGSIILILQSFPAFAGSDMFPTVEVAKAICPGKNDKNICKNINWFRIGVFSVNYSERHYDIIFGDAKIIMNMGKRYIISKYVMKNNSVNVVSGISLFSYLDNNSIYQLYSTVTGDNYDLSIAFRELNNENKIK